MGITQDKQGIREEFTSKGFDVSRVHAAFTTATKLFEDNQDHGKSLQALMSDIKGLDLANLLGGRRALTSAAATMQASTAAEKRSKQAADDWAFYLNLIQNGQVGHYIADKIFDNKSDWEIFQIVAEIEAATGDSFENYAKSILGEDNVPKRFDGESDADYQRRVLKVITAEILDPNTGQIKPQYADDPVANIIRDHKAYRRIIAKTADINADVKRNGITQKTIEETDKISQNASGADVAANELEAAALKDQVRTNQDDLRDIKTNNEFASDDNMSFMDEIPLEQTTIAKASEAGKQEFNTKSQDETSELASATPSINFEIKPT